MLTNTSKFEEVKCPYCDTMINRRMSETTLRCPCCNAIAVRAGGHTVSSRNDYDTDSFDSVVREDFVRSFWNWQFPRNWFSGNIECRNCGKIFHATRNSFSGNDYFDFGDGPVCDCHHKNYNPCVYIASENNWKILK